MIKSQGKALAYFGILPDQFYMMEVGELNAALEQREQEERRQIERWRYSNYVNAAPHFDPKKPTPSITDWYPLPWDKEYVSKKEFIPYDEQIEFAIKRGRKDWIPDHWFKQSEKYKHLCRSEPSKITKSPKVEHPEG